MGGASFLGAHFIATAASPYSICPDAISLTVWQVAAMSLPCTECTSNVERVFIGRQTWIGHYVWCQLVDLFLLSLSNKRHLRSRRVNFKVIWNCSHCDFSLQLCSACVTLDDITTNIAHRAVTLRLHGFFTSRSGLNVKSLSETLHCAQKVHLFIFLNNSVKSEPILITFGQLNPETNWHEYPTDLSTSFVRCSHFTLWNLKKSCSTLLFIYFRLFTLPKKN